MTDENRTVLKNAGILLAVGLALMAVAVAVSADPPTRKPERIVNTPGILNALTIEIERNNEVRVTKPERIVNTPGILNALTIEIERNNEVRVTKHGRMVLRGSDTMKRTLKTRRKLAKDLVRVDRKPDKPLGGTTKKDKPE